LVWVYTFKKFNFTADYYNIKVKGRELYWEIERSTILFAVTWFENSFDSRTSGLDVVAKLQQHRIGEGKLGFNLSGNITFKTKNFSPKWLLH
jgi:iron complex outermembrane receptor protein